MTNNFCVHCRGAKHVFVPWLEHILRRNGIFLADVPPEIFEKIPIEFLCYCHCSVGVLRFPKTEGPQCRECEGTTWRFSEAGREAGYPFKKVIDLSPSEIKSLSCAFFERCSCGVQEDGSKEPTQENVQPDILEVLRSIAPNLALGS